MKDYGPCPECGRGRVHFDTIRVCGPVFYIYYCSDQCGFEIREYYEYPKASRHYIDKQLEKAQKGNKHE